MARKHKHKQKTSSSASRKNTDGANKASDIRKRRLPGIRPQAPAPEWVGLADVNFKPISAMSLKPLLDDTCIENARIKSVGMYLELYQSFLRYIRLAGMPTPQLSGISQLQNIQEMYNILKDMITEDNPKAELLIIYEEYSKKSLFLAYEEYQIHSSDTIYVLPLEFFAMLKARGNQLYHYCLPLLKKLIQFGYSTPQSNEYLFFSLEHVMESADDPEFEDGEPIQGHREFPTDNPKTSMFNYSAQGPLSKIMEEIEKAGNMLYYPNAIKSEDAKYKRGLMPLVKWLCEGYELMNEKRSLSEFEVPFTKDDDMDFHPVELSMQYLMAWSASDWVMDDYMDMCSQIAYEAGSGQNMPSQVLIIDKKTPHLFKVDDWFNRFYQWNDVGTNFMIDYVKKEREKRKWPI